MMRNKTNQRIALATLSVGVLLSSLAANNVVAAECGQAKLIEAGSVGVNVTNNPCQSKSRLNLGSTVEMPSGARMWLKFDPVGGEGFQLICQNKSANPVSVNLASTNTPWIKPQGLKNCDKWTANKLSCDSSEGEKNSFFCAIASTKPKHSNAAPEVTTSIKMRSILPPTVPIEDIIKDIKPEIELCKNLYNVSEKLSMSWTVSLGIIKDLSVNSQNPDLVACVEGVIKQANAKQDLTVNYSF
jgi:hypothetical protein